MVVVSRGPGRRRPGCRPWPRPRSRGDDQDPVQDTTARTCPTTVHARDIKALRFGIRPGGSAMGQVDDVLDRLTERIASQEKRESPSSGAQRLGQERQLRRPSPAGRRRLHPSRSTSRSRRAAAGQPARDCQPAPGTPTCYLQRPTPAGDYRAGALDRLGPRRRRRSLPTPTPPGRPDLTGTAITAGPGVTTGRAARTAGRTPAVGPPASGTLWLAAPARPEDRYRLTSWSPRWPAGRSSEPPPRSRLHGRGRSVGCWAGREVAL